MGHRLVGVAVDDEANDRKGEAIAQQFCDDPATLGVVGHVNSGVTIAASAVYAQCELEIG